MGLSNIFWGLGLPAGLFAESSSYADSVSNGFSDSTSAFENRSPSLIGGGFSGCDVDLGFVGVVTSCENPSSSNLSQSSSHTADISGIPGCHPL